MAAVMAFEEMTEEQLRQFIEGNPHYVNEWDRSRRPVLFIAVQQGMNPTFITWLVGKGADVNKCCECNSTTPLFYTQSAEVVDILLRSGANPAHYEKGNHDNPLMVHCYDGRVDFVERLLRERLVLEQIYAQDNGHHTALASACWPKSVVMPPSKRLQIIEMLLYAGADPTIADGLPHWRQGKTPLNFLREKNPDSHAAIAFLHHATSFLSPRGYYLTKARHIIAAHHALTRATSSFLQPRRPPLPRVDLVAPPSSQDQDGDDEQREKERMAVLQYVLGQNEDGLPGGGLLGELFIELILFMRPE